MSFIVIVLHNSATDKEEKDKVKFQCYNTLKIKKRENIVVM